MPHDAARQTEQTAPVVMASRRRWMRPVAAAAGVFAVAAGLVLLNGYDGSERPLGARIPPAGPTDQADPAGERASLAGRVLERQDAALRQGSQAAYLATWDSHALGGHRRAQHIYANLSALGVTELDPRYVAADSGLSLAAERRLGGDAWKADVDVSYTIPEFDGGRAQTSVSYTFVRRGDSAMVAGIEPADSQRTPIWLLPRLQVARSARTLVAAATAPEARRVSRHLRQAVTDIEEVLPSWRGQLVAFVPGNSSQLEAFLAAAPGSYDGIAGVTTTVDGSSRSGAPVAIVINAEVFDGLGPIGSHVVVTHESTHAATHAVVVAMPLWVAEGFADYVGVGAVDLPLSVSARAVIRHIRREGLPTTLPSNADFDARSSDLEVYYEQAWTANRLIADRHGRVALVRFYTAVVQRPRGLAHAFERLGTSEQLFTAAWRDSLRSVVQVGGRS